MLLTAALIATTVPATIQASSTDENIKELGEYTDFSSPATGSSDVLFDITDSSKYPDDYPFFTVKIPKMISLDSDGAGVYTVGVKGRIPELLAVKVVPDEEVIMTAEHGWSNDITATVTPAKTDWTKAELAIGKAYVDSDTNRIAMASVDYETFKGTLNFAISTEKQTT